MDLAQDPPPFCDICHQKNVFFKASLKFVVGPVPALHKTFYSICIHKTRLENTDPILC